MSNQLTILPVHKSIEVLPQETILEAIRRQIQFPELETPCNGKGYCGKCKIRIITGPVTEPSQKELHFLTEKELDDHIRLACMCQCTSDEPVTIELLEKNNKGSVLDHYQLGRYNLNPSIGPMLSASSGTDHTIGMIKTQIPAYGVAIDIGTTTIASVLMDLNTGEGIAKASCINPQTQIGGDVLSRIEHAMTHENGLKQLCSIICHCIDTLTLSLIQKSHIDSNDIYGYAIAANTTMLHLLLEVDPSSIAMAPYIPAFVEAQTLPVSRLHLTHCRPDATVYCLPSVSGYIGADITAGIYMSRIYETDKNIMFIDIGTNGEIVLSIKGQLHSCSCAAGPALEGMNITCGMRAAEGAIEHVHYKNGHFHIKTIADAPAEGICGSGVLETMAALLQSGAVESSGKISRKLDESLSSYLTKVDNKKAFLITEGKSPVYFSQGDIRQVQLAKGAILSGFVALLEKNQMTLDDLDEVIIAGQFGSYLNQDTLIATGILPDNARGKIKYIGNSSLSGAILCLLDASVKEKMSEIAKDVNYFELATYPGYTKLLMECLAFPA